MNPWDIDPTLYAALWRIVLKWYRGRRANPKAGQRAAERPTAGCRA